MPFVLAQPNRENQRTETCARDELEEFFRATDVLENKELKFLGWRGAMPAVKTIKRLPK